MHTCNGCKGMPTHERVWHGFYSAWYGHHEAGHRVRAAIFGRLADATCRMIWP